MKKIYLTSSLNESPNEGESIATNCLTKRESQILTLLASGLNNPQIAEKLFISRYTVEQHRKNIIRKLHAKLLAHLVLYAQKAGLIEMPNLGY